RLRRHERGTEILRELLVPRFLGQVVDTAPTTTGRRGRKVDRSAPRPGVVREDVQPPKTFDDASDAGLYLLLFGNVAGEPHPRRRERPRGPFGLLAIEVDERHGRALACEDAANSGANTACASRNNGHFAIEIAQFSYSFNCRGRFAAKDTEDTEAVSAPFFRPRGLRGSSRPVPRSGLLLADKTGLPFLDKR